MFYAIDKRTGDVVWDYNIKKDGDQMSFHGEMLITEELVLIGCDQSIGHVYAFDKETGDVRWKYSVGKGAATDLLTDGTSAYTVTLQDEVIALDLDSGELGWSFATQSDTSFLWTQPASLVDDRVFFGGRDGFVYALDAPTGDVMWLIEIGARVSTAVLAHGEDLYFGVADNVMYRLAQATGEIVADYALPAIPVGRPAIKDGKLFVFVNSWGGGGRGELLVALDPSLDRELWTREPGSVFSMTKPRFWRDLVLTGENDGRLVACRLEDGTPDWSFEIDGEIRSIGWDGDTLYVGTIGGMLYAIAPLR